MVGATSSDGSLVLRRSWMSLFGVTVTADILRTIHIVAGLF